VNNREFARKELPMATTSINIVQRLDGPMLTTFVSVILAWQLRIVSPRTHCNERFADAFWFLSACHALCFIFTLGLPTFLSLDSERTSKAILQAVEGLVD